MRYLMTFSYDGSAFNGYQKQVDKRSVQGEIEAVLSQISNQKITISASGRTDAKVHALNQKAHFDIDKELDVNKYKHSLNSLLSEDIYIKNIVKVSNKFHARYNVKEKTYIYKINIGNYNPLMRNYIYQYNKPLNIEDMEKGIKLFLGEHDFKAFSTDTLDKDTIRTIYKATIKSNNNIITISFTGNGFLRYMVRNMVGLLIEIGEGKDYKKVTEIIDSKDRKMAGIKAPGCGLYLKNVKY